MTEKQGYVVIAILSFFAPLIMGILLHLSKIEELLRGGR
jgi:hypothetical protein